MSSKRSHEPSCQHSLDLKARSPEKNVCSLVGYKSHCPRSCSVSALEKQLLLSMRHQQLLSATLCAV